MKENVQKQFGENFRRIRKAKRLTQEIVAERASVPSSYISELENGNANPTLQTTERLARGLDVDISELFFFKYGRATPEQIRERIKAVVDEADSQALHSLYDAVLAVFNPRK